MYGCIDETELSLSFPRAIDGDECETVEAAWEQALELIREGAEKVTVCEVKYYGDDGNGYWGETQTAFRSVSIEAGEDCFLREEEEKETA